MEGRVVSLVLEALAPEAANREIGLETHLRRDLGLDSLGLVSLLVRCGESLGIDGDELVEIVDVSAISTVGDLVRMSEKLASERAS